MRKPFNILQLFRILNQALNTLIFYIHKGAQCIAPPIAFTQIGWKDRKNFSTFINHQIDKVLVYLISNFNTWPYECIRLSNFENNILDNPADRYCNMHFYILQSNCPYKVHCNHSYMSQNKSRNKYKSNQNCNHFLSQFHGHDSRTAIGLVQWHRGWGGRLLPHF